MPKNKFQDVIFTAIMAPIAFILEFFIVGKLARMPAFTVMKPTDRSYA